MTKLKLIGSASLIALALSQPAFAIAGETSAGTPSAEDIQNILMRLEQLEQENQSYKERLNQVEQNRAHIAPVIAVPES